MTRKLWLWSLVSLLLAAPSVASQPNVPPALQRKSRYLGAHPITNVVNGYCQIDVPHTHGYSPDKPALYQRVGEDYVFTGDPVPFGYDGQKTVFYGHHPVPVHVEALPGSVPPPPTFCFLKGPHFHEYPVAHEAPGYKEMCIRDRCRPLVCAWRCCLRWPWCPGRPRAAGTSWR